MLTFSILSHGTCIAFAMHIDETKLFKGVACLEALMKGAAFEEVKWPVVCVKLEVELGRANGFSVLIVLRSPVVVPLNEVFDRWHVAGRCLLFGGDHGVELVNLLAALLKIILIVHVQSYAASALLTCLLFDFEQMSAHLGERINLVLRSWREFFIFDLRNAEIDVAASRAAAVV